MLYTEYLGLDKPSTLLFLHGIAGSTASWGTEFRSLACEYNLVMVDALGFGDSPKPDNINYTIGDHLYALSEVIEKIQAEHITVIGHSMGSILALSLLQRYPNRIERIVLMSLPLFQNPSDTLEVISASSLFNRWMALGNSLSHFICTLVCKYRNRIMPLMPYFLSKLPPQVARNSIKHNWASYSGTLKNIVMAHKSQDELVHLKCPTLFVHGRHDTLARWAKIDPWTHALPNSKLLLLEGGHDIVFTHEERIVRHLKWWLENTTSDVTQ